MTGQSATVLLTRQLIACRSVTPADGGCQELLIERLEPLGFDIERLRYGEVDNFWAMRRGGSGPIVCFAGHTDVVPPGPLERWHTDPFDPVIQDGLLYGRGAADMKSGLAAMLTATESFVAERPRHAGSIAFLITSDEEGPSVDGTRRVVEALRGRSQRIDYCVVGEPSSQQEFGDTIRIGRRGSLSGRLTVRGIQGHVAYPDRALNPIHAILPAFGELSSRRWDDGNEHFPPTSFQVSNIRSGTGASNVIPGELEALFNLRWSPVQTLEGLKSAVSEILGRHGLRYVLDWFEAGLPYYTPPGVLSSLVAASVEEVADRRPLLSTGGGTSDGRFFGALGAEVVEFGVVNQTIHQVDESCRVADIDRLHRVYAGMLRRAFGD